MQLAYSVSCKGRKSASIMKESLWTNNVNFVKDVPMIYANFIIIAITLSGKKGGITFIPALHIIVTHHL